MFTKGMIIFLEKPWVFHIYAGLPQGPRVSLHELSIDSMNHLWNIAILDLLNDLSPSYQYTPHNHLQYRAPFTPSPSTSHCASSSQLSQL